MTAKAVPTDEQLGHFARHQHDVFERVRKGSLDAGEVMSATQAIIDRARPQYPADEEEFELTLDFGSPEADPIQMVRSDGYPGPENWKFNGAKLSGVQTKRFKLVRVGHCHNLDEVRAKLAEYGPVPEGQWREAFKAAFPKPDGNGPVGFADSSWVNPLGIARFPVVGSDGGSSFCWAVNDHDVYWRWLVPACK